MSSAPDPRIERAPRAPITVDHPWLVDLAHRLARIPDAPALHVVVAHDLESSTDQHSIELHTLPLADPVGGLIGRRAPAGACAVGLAGPSWVHSLDDTRVPASGTFVHLLTARGVSVTIVPATRPGSPAQVLGPTHDIQMGRIPDACRRILDLPTASPPPDTIDLLVDDWLERLLSASLVNGGLSWSDVLECHPLLLSVGLTGEPWRPSALAEAMRVAGRSVSWQCLRTAHLERSGDECLYPKDWLEWVDAGMFARWVLEEGLPRSVVLEALGHHLPGSVHDRLTATLSLLSIHDDEPLRYG